MNGGRRAAQRPRGEPLLVLGLIVGGWLGLRFAVWEPPLSLRAPAPIRASNEPTLPKADVKAAAVHPLERSSGQDGKPRARSSWLRRLTPLPVGSASLDEESSANSLADRGPVLTTAVANEEPPPSPAASLTRQGNAGLAAERRRRLSPAPAIASRWSGDAWLLVRNGSMGPIAAGQPSYGRSQVGGVLRYSLAPASGHRPTLYLRATRALAGPRENEAALGFAARPLAGVPMRIAGEVRISNNGSYREVRPAAFAVTELPPVDLPLGLRAETYAQAGYVGGRFATAFVDGQARLGGLLARLGRDAVLRAGAGMWGGAQKDAARLDLGPSATAALRIGRARTRIALDYRLRVAGDAEPKSGPALTISAGF